MQRAYLRPNTTIKLSYLVSSAVSAHDTYLFVNQKSQNNDKNKQIWIVMYIDIVIDK